MMSIWKALFILVALISAGCGSKQKSGAGGGDTAAAPQAAGAEAVQKTAEDDELTLDEFGDESDGGKRTQSPAGYEDLKAAVKKGDVKAIEEEVARILAKDKNDIKALNALAVFHYQKGNWKAAKTVLQRAFENQSEHAALYNNLGLVLSAEGSLRESIVAFKKAMRLDPRHWEAHRNLADLYVKFGDYNRAAPLYEAVAAQATLDEGAQINRALVLWKTGKAAQAKELFANLYKTAGGQEFLYMYAAFLIFEVKDYKTGKEVVGKLKNEKLKKQSQQMVTLLEKQIGQKGEVK